MSVGGIPATNFGMHIHRAATTTPWPAVTFGSWRLWDADTTWFHLEPSAGAWHFDLMDQYVALAEKHNVDLLLPLGFCPAWASSRPDETSPYFPPGALAPPLNIEDWRRYITTVATRYKGRLHSYEVWNEPNLKEYWTGTTKELVNLAREAKQVLKAIDPRITVVGPSATNRETGPAWLDEYLLAGGGDHLDVIAHHFYVFPSPPEATTSFVRRVRQIMANRGVSEKPLWNSEMGWARPATFASDVKATGYLARAHLLNWVTGVERCYWYAWDNQEWVTLWLTEQDSTTLKPAAIGYQELQKWLIGSEIVSCTLSDANIYTCRLIRNDGYSAQILWNADQEVSYTVPREWGVNQLRDLTGGRHAVSGQTPVTIGPVPILLEHMPIPRTLP